MEKVETLPDACIVAAERDSKVLSLMNSSLLREIFWGASELPPCKKEEDEVLTENHPYKIEPQSPISCRKPFFEGLDSEPENRILVDCPDVNLPNKIEPQSPISCRKPFFEGLDSEPENRIIVDCTDVNPPNKIEPQSPISSCRTFFESLDLEENRIRVDFPDLKPVFFKGQSRVNRISRQRILDGRVKIRVTTLGPQVQSIEVYVERTAPAAVLVGNDCGRVSLKPRPGSHYLNKYNFTVDLDSVYESPKRNPVYKLSTVDSERRNIFRLSVIVVLIGDARCKEFISAPFRLRSKRKTGGRSIRSLSL